MNNDTGGTRSSRSAGLAAVLAVVAVLAAACGGSAPSSSTDAASGGSTAYQKALAYSECMRSHGVPDFPDPNAEGNIQVAPGSPNDPMNNSVGQAAENACRHLLPGSSSSNTGTEQQTVDQLLNLAKCMRAHGEPTFPDPKVSGGSVTLPAGLDFSSPQFKAAERACKSLIPAGLFPSS